MDGVGARLGSVASRASGAQMTWLCRWRGERRRRGESTSWLVSWREEVRNGGRRESRRNLRLEGGVES